VSISDDEKAEIHYLLDYLLMTRSNLEKVNPSELSPGMQYAFAWSRPRSEFIVAASKFLRRVIGEKLHKAELPDPFVRELSENTSGGENLAFVANALRSFMPLFVPLSEGKEASNFMEFTGEMTHVFFRFSRSHKECTRDHLGLHTCVLGHSIGKNI